MDMSGCTFFLKVGFVAQGNSWVRMDQAARLPAAESLRPEITGTDVRMVTWDYDSEAWYATYGQTYRNNIRWRSPGFDDPVAAYVFAELNQWGM